MVYSHQNTYTKTLRVVPSPQEFNLAPKHQCEKRTQPVQQVNEKYEYLEEVVTLATEIIHWRYPRCNCREIRHKI